MMTYRIQTPLQKIVTAFILVLFLTTVFFGFAAVMHDPVEGMQGNCPFSVMGEPLCPQNLMAATVHHIASYQSFLSAFPAAGTLAAIIALLIALSAALLLLAAPLLYKSPKLTRLYFAASSTVQSDKKEIRWLSLFENSPSVA